MYSSSSFFVYENSDSSAAETQPVQQTEVKPPEIKDEIAKPAPKPTRRRKGKSPKRIQRQEIKHDLLKK